MKYLILGAGPAGLSFAHKLLLNGCDDFLVLEKEAVVGGLCRSEEVDGTELDIGGGHFLDVRRPEVNEFLFRFMPKDEWNLFNRDSRIDLDGFEIGHPFEANIWQMPVDEQIEYIKSVFEAGCNQGVPQPKAFTDWIYWKLGERIAEKYMLPYNKKMFGKNLDLLGTYWLDKLPSVSLEETLRSCLERRPFGSQPGHASFYYPKKYGYGELFRRMGNELGNKLRTQVKVTEIDVSGRTVTTQDNDRFNAETIVTTIPWTSFSELYGVPDDILYSINKLKYSSIQIDYYKDNMDTKAHWVYYPDEKLMYHRILVRHNFCGGSRGYWTETNTDRATKKSAVFSYINEYAYPLNTRNKPEIMKKILGFMEENKIIGLGRWGEWQHYNSDVVIKLSMDLADRCEG